MTAGGCAVLSAHKTTVSSAKEPNIIQSEIVRKTDEGAGISRGAVGGSSQERSDGQIPAQSLAAKGEDEASGSPLVIPPEIPEGVLFAKTDFQGVLKTVYVKWTIVNLDNPADRHELIIGDKTKQTPLGWNSADAVEPGYFFVKLPVGKYLIETISIPVGSTLAVEPFNVSFEIFPDMAVYGGTVQVTGTKETIKLGVMPVIQPGFEYHVTILDDRDEGFDVFRKNYSDFQGTLKVGLMEKKDTQLQGGENAGSGF